MFGKLYFLGTGLMLLLIGTGLSFVEEMISETCDKISSMSQGITIAFNPCDVFAMLPTAAIVMQIMGAVARERGFKERYLTQLCTPSMGITYGVKHLTWLRDIKGYSGDDLISAYNQGSPRRLKIVESSVNVSPNAKYAEYKNQHYVNKINSVYQGLVEKRIFDAKTTPISVA